MYWNNDTTRHVTSSNNPVRRGIERAGDLHRVAMSDEEIDHTISPVTMMPDVGEDHAEPTIEMEYPDDDGYADARAAARTAGFQPQNWREYPGGTGNEFQNADGDWVDVQADYFDALYPEENPSAIWDGSYVYVFDSTGEVILNKEAYDFQEAQQVANKALEKAYKGEAKPEPGQQMFFRTPGKGKLFSNRTASLFDQYYEWCEQMGLDELDPASAEEYAWEKMLSPTEADSLKKTVGQGRSEMRNARVASRRSAANVCPTSQKPGKGKLFSSRTAAWSLLDQVNHTPVHRVAGWDWDHQIEGYVSDGVADFACICGSNVEAPGHVVCECGKMWNSYTIAASDGMRLVCREVPVRENVLLARREQRR